MSKKEYILGVDYTIEEGRVVWTSEYLAKKGTCWGTKATTKELLQGKNL